MPTNLFIVEGQPLKFCLETFKCFGILIQDHGGVVVDEPDNETYTLSDPNFQLKTKHQVERYHIEFAVESIHLGKLLDIRKYRIYEESKKESRDKPVNKLNDSSNVKLESNNFTQKICVLELDQISLKNNKSPPSPSNSFTPQRALRSNLKEVIKKEESQRRESKKRSRDDKKISDIKEKNHKETIEQINNEKNDKNPGKNHQNNEHNFEKEEKHSPSASAMNNSNKRKIIYVDDDSDSGSESIILMKSDGSDGKFEDDSCDSEDDDDDLEVSIDDYPQNHKENKDKTSNDLLWNGKRSRITSNGEIIFKSWGEKDYRDPKGYHQDLSGTGKFILPWEQDAIINWMIKSNSINCKGITQNAWITIQAEEGILRYRNPKSIGIHLVKKILPNIDDWELPLDVRNQFISLRETVRKRKRQRR